MRRAVAGLIAAAALLGCGGDEATGVRVEARYSQSRAFDQFVFALATTGALDFASGERRPSAAGAALSSPQSLVFLIKDELHGMSVKCGVQAFRAGGAVASNGSTVVVQRGEIRDCLVNLDPGDSGPPPSDGAGSGGAGGTGGAGSGGAAGWSGGSGGPGGAGGMGGTGGTGGTGGMGGTDGTGGTGAMGGSAGTGGTGGTGGIGGGTPDAPIDQPLPPDGPVDMPPPPPTGCADNAARTGFVDRAAFPNIAGCGTPVSFGDAAQMAVTTCAPGWSLCRHDVIAASTSATAPGTTNGAACGWVARTLNAGCDARLTVHTALGCAGAAERSVATTADGTACALDALLCTTPWRVAVPLDGRWGQTSVRHGACFNHLMVECAASLGGQSCLVTCCKDP